MSKCPVHELEFDSLEMRAQQTLCYLSLLGGILLVVMAGYRLVVRVDGDCRESVIPTTWGLSQMRGKEYLGKGWLGGLLHAFDIQGVGHSHRSNGHLWGSLLYLSHSKTLHTPSLSDHSARAGSRGLCMIVTHTVSSQSPKIIMVNDQTASSRLIHGHWCDSECMAMNPP